MPAGVYIRKKKRTWKLSATAKKHISLGMTGRMHSDATKLKQSFAKLNEKHYHWSGENVSYSGLHKWVRRKLGTPRYCEHCKSRDEKAYDWAHKTHIYKRNLNDWIRLCRKCHKKYDRDILKVKLGRPPYDN